MLIDTGSTISILDPAVVEKYYPNNVVNENLEIRTAKGNIPINKYAFIPCFNELKCSGYLRMIMLKFHNFYDGIIGFDDLKAMQFNIDLSKGTLYRENYNLPIQFKKTENFKVPAKAQLLKKMPVNYIEGDVLIESITENGVHIPSCITTVNKGEALVEIQNWLDKEQLLDIKSLSVTPLENYHVYQYQIHDVDAIDRLNGMIRTEHMNEEEKI